MIVAGAAHAAVPACSVLPNTANISFSVEGASRTLASNVANVRVNELLDLQLTATSTTAAIAQGEVRGVPFALANIGNGSEAFIVEARIEGSGASVEGIAIDRNSNGRFDAAEETMLVSGTAIPAVAAGAGAPLLALVRVDAEIEGASLIVTARAATGSGIAGTGFEGQGDGGCDAVVGGTTASASASVTLTVAEGTDISQISLVKSQSVVARNGSASPTPGATITYAIEARFGGDETVRNARLADPIPAGTTYVAGSLRLDGAALSDGDDTDQGRFDGTAIRVALGDVPGRSTRRIEFQVTIQ